MRHFRRNWRAFAWITVAIYVLQTVGIAAHNTAFAHEHVFGHDAHIGHVHADHDHDHDHHHGETGPGSDHHHHGDHSEHEAPHSDENCQHWLAWLTASSGSAAAKLAVVVPFTASTELNARPEFLNHWADETSPFDARGPPHFPFV